MIGNSPGRSVERTMSPPGSSSSTDHVQRSKSLGRRGEELAAAHSDRPANRSRAHTHRPRWGELDLVPAARDGDTIVFAGVKTRRSGSGEPWDNLHGSKREQVRRMAAAWLH